MQLSRIPRGTYVKSRIIIRSQEKVFAGLEDDEADLTGCTVFLTIRRKMSDAEPIISKSSGVLGGIVIADQGTDMGACDVEFFTEDTAEQVPGKCFMDIQVLDQANLQKEALAPREIWITDTATRLYEP